MALYDDRKRSFFPNTGQYSGTTGHSFMQPSGLNTGYNATGMAEGQARMDQIAATSTYKSRRAGGSMVSSPQGGSMFVPTGQLQSYLDKGYTNYQAPRTALQQYDINQAYQQGYGAPAAAQYNAPGGPYMARGGVASPYTPPNIFQRTGSAITGGLQGIGTFAANLFNRPYSSPNQRTQSQNFYAYNPSPVPQKPNRYFDNNY